MIDPFVENGFVVEGNDYNDLDVYKKDRVFLVSMHKFKNDKREFRQSGNHLDDGLISELCSILDTAAKRDDIKSLIITSSHRVAFSRGAKIEVILGATTEQCYKFIKGAQKLIIKCHQFPKPIVAAITGLTLGGGLELAMACDYRIASDRENVVFGLPESSLGIIPGMGGTQNLPRIVGKKIALDMMRNARVDVFAKHALEYGIIEKIVESNNLIEEAYSFASKKDLKKVTVDLSENKDITSSKIIDEIKEYLKTAKIEIESGMKAAPISRSLLSFIVDKTEFCSLIDGLKYEQEVFAYLQQTEDCKEGIQALIKERSPVFKGK